MNHAIEKESLSVNKLPTLLISPELSQCRFGSVWMCDCSCLDANVDVTLSPFWRTKQRLDLYLSCNALKGNISVSIRILPLLSSSLLSISQLNKKTHDQMYYINPNILRNILLQCPPKSFIFSYHLPHLQWLNILEHQDVLSYRTICQQQNRAIQEECCECWYFPFLIWYDTAGTCKKYHTQKISRTFLTFLSPWHSTHVYSKTFLNCNNKSCLFMLHVK